VNTPEQFTEIEEAVSQDRRAEIHEMACEVTVRLVQADLRHVDVSAGDSVFHGMSTEQIYRRLILSEAQRELQPVC
jgi:hypothetical protein